MSSEPAKPGYRSPRVAGGRSPGRRSRCRRSRRSRRPRRRTDSPAGCPARRRNPTRRAPPCRTEPVPPSCRADREPALERVHVGRADRQTGDAERCADGIPVRIEADPCQRDAEMVVVAREPVAVDRDLAPPLGLPEIERTEKLAVEHGDLAGIGASSEILVRCADRQIVRAVAVEVCGRKRVSEGVARPPGAPPRSHSPRKTLLPNRRFH